VTRPSTQYHYQRRFDALIDYMFQHLNDRLDLQTLAEVACISPYHLHRLYRCHFGETLADTTRRLRLHYAAQALLKTTRRLDSIALDAGYGSVQAFNRSFRAAFGMPPAAFRDQGLEAPFKSAERPVLLEPGPGWSIRLVKLPEMTVHGLPHTGDFMDIGQTFERLFTRLATRQHLTPGLRPCSLYWDDPDSVATDRVRSLVGGIGMTGSDIGELSVQHLPAGLYAVVRFTGPYHHLHQVYHWLFGTWLPSSGYWPGNAPVMEEYVNTPREVPPSDLKTDIYVPLIEDTDKVLPTRATNTPN